MALVAGLALPSARACEFFAATLRVWHPWTYALRPGETTAIVSLSFDQVTAADRLVGVSTPVATGAELVVRGAAGPVALDIPEGRETVLREDRDFIRLTGIEEPLLIGRSYPLRLAFEKGGTVQAQLNIDYVQTLLRARSST